MKNRPPVGQALLDQLKTHVATVLNSNQDVSATLLKDGFDLAEPERGKRCSNAGSSLATP
jgi:hypothetical protein